MWPLAQNIVILTNASFTINMAILRCPCAQLRFFWRTHATPVRGTALLTSSCTDFVRLHTEQGHSTSSITTPPSGDDATLPSGNGPAPLYNSIPNCLILLLFTFLFKSVINLNTCTCLVLLILVMEILLIIGIKIRLKTHNYPKNEPCVCVGGAGGGANFA